MPAALIDQLHEVGSTCRALAAWCRCGNGHEDHCEACSLGGPDRCEGEVIKALVGKVIAARLETDAALEMAKYWQGLSSRLCDAVMK